MPLTLVTWNLKGSNRHDVAAVAAHLRAVGADVVALQEVQRRQANELARRLGAYSLTWGFKHWPVTVRPEGMAILGLAIPIEVDTRALSFRWRLWSSRRRIYQVARFLPSGSDAERWMLFNLHLSTAREAERRAHEVATVLRTIGTTEDPAIVGGDLNDRPGAPLFAQFGAAGLRDAWAEVHPDADETEGATNWPGWRPGTTKDPSRRLDYVLVNHALDVVAVDIPRPGEPGFDGFRTLSDHLPLTVTLASRAPRPACQTRRP
jgi:endonuclease/exonuclease/phosphatase family metal-dependent hydrolase